MPRIHRKTVKKKEFGCLGMWPSSVTARYYCFFETLQIMKMFLSSYKLKRLVK